MLTAVGLYSPNGVKRVLDRMQQNELSRRVVTCIDIRMFMMSRGDGNCKEEKGGSQKELFCWI